MHCRPLPSGWFWIGIALLCGVANTGISTATAADRYSALLRDGTRISGNEIRPWHEPNQRPQLAGKWLLDPANPARWIEDRSLEPAATPASYVEFTGGDRLAGQVLGLERGTEYPWEHNFDVLWFEPTTALNWPEYNRPQGRIRILPNWLRRVVWQNRGSDRYVASTAFMRDGRQLPFRALRWLPDGVRLLRQEGTLDLRFGQIAEIHFPQQDFWTAYTEQLAALNTEGSFDLVRIETIDGLRLLTSAERWEAAHWRDGNDPNAWMQRVQPAWSLDPLWVRFRTIRSWKLFPPDRVPLSLIAPTEVELHNALSGGWNWHVDRNVQRGRLRSGERDYGWGFGVQAFCRLQFPLPPYARAFEASVGLDELVGRGGCARPSVQLEQNNQVQELFKGPILVGSSEVASTGRLELTGLKPGAHLALVADPVYQGRPDGADPLDIRDQLDWLEPTLELSAPDLREAIRSRVLQVMSPWAGWQVESADPGPVAVVGEWDVNDFRPAAWRREFIPRQPFLTLSQKVTVAQQNRFLALQVARFENATQPTKLEVLVDGAVVGTYDVPIRYRSQEPAPITIPLQGYLGKEIKIQIRHLPAGQRGLLDWRGIHYLPEPPGVKLLFDEEPQFVDQLKTGEGKIVVNRAVPAAAGSASLQVTGMEIGNAKWDGEPLRIRERPKLGEYRYLRFAWKQEGGKLMCLSLGHDGELGTTSTPRSPRGSDRRIPLYRYDNGEGEPSFGGALRLTGTTKDWVLVTRDLYNDFGEFDLTGLSFSAQGEGTAQFDHLYLLRDSADLERLEIKPNSGVKERK